MKKYYNIALLTNIPLNRGAFFTYASENVLEKGALVVIPFGRKKETGVVIEEVEKPQFKGIKSVSKIISQHSVVSKNQFKVAEFISKYYLSAFGLVLKLFTPKIVSTSRVKDKVVTFEKASPPKLTVEQKKTINIFKNDPKGTFLLYGPTGSGKTEVYIQMISHALSLGGQALLLVPEISLVPQNIERIMERFTKKRVVLLHSKLSQGERYKTWQQIKNKEADIVIGPRSALFLPFQDLKIIIIDEEHDQSFKQYDQNPRYNALTVARFMSQFMNIPLVLGSATPEVEDFYRADKNKDTLLTLSSRIHQEQMPEVRVVDMKDEFKKKNFSIFSEVLTQEMEHTLEQKKQIVLFINRRGAASYVTCRTCGYVAECTDCSIPYTYHIFGKNQGLVCHHCGKREKPPNTCPECNSKAIKFLGGGTEKVYAALHTLFPEARIARMDKDTTSRKGAHEKLFNQFKNHEIDILVGTQMISKGWDLPKVDLVGIVSADVGLHFPDFRASEKAFQLLTQVAGRTGRRHSRGKVVLQTYYPEHEVIDAVQGHDFELFYEKEITARKDLLYPPFSKLIKLIIEGKNEYTVLNKAEKVLDELVAILDPYSVECMGPAPSFFSGVSGIHKAHIVLKFASAHEEKIKETLKESLSADWKIDVDPASLL